jgi:hypothetical protein
VALVEDLFEHPVETSALLASDTGASWNYAPMCVLTLLFVWKVTLESKGNTPEEIDCGLGLPKDRRILHSALNLESQFSARYRNRKLNATVSWFSTECPSSSAG